MLSSVVDDPVVTDAVVDDAAVDGTAAVGPSTTGGGYDAERMVATWYSATEVAMPTLSDSVAVEIGIETI